MIINKFLSLLNRYKTDLPTFTIVGVGPGDPSLLTIAAVDAIKKANVIVFPISDDNKKSFAAEIVKKYSGDSPHNEFLHFGIQVGLFGILFIILFYFTLIKRSAQLLIDRNNDYEIISNALFSMVIGIIVWIFANDMLLAGMGALIILIMAFVDKMNFYINHA